MAFAIDYILLFTASAIVIYILYRMISKSMSEKKTVDPPYDNNANSAQMKQLNSIAQSGDGVAITNASFPSDQDNALRNFCIKSSFNSAYTGGYMNLDMIEYVLRRGCRFLDFQVFIKDNTAIVAYSKDDDVDAFTSDSPALSLGGVLRTINMNAFNEHSPNPNDPLFINIRILSNLPAAQSIVAETIAASLQERLYTNPNTGYAVPIDLNVQMQKLYGKIIVMTDEISTTSPSPSPSQSNASSMKLSNYVNLFTGSNMVRVYTESQLTYQPINPPDPYVYNMHIVTPNLGIFYGIKNSDNYYLVQNYGAQIVAQAFYSKDMNLLNYEKLFNDNKSAFVFIPTIVNS